MSCAPIYYYVCEKYVPRYIIKNLHLSTHLLTYVSLKASGLLTDNDFIPVSTPEFNYNQVPTYKQGVQKRKALYWVPDFIIVLKSTLCSISLASQIIVTYDWHDKN